jgi:hypothetical protein
MSPGATISMESVSHKPTYGILSHCDGHDALPSNTMIDMETQTEGYFVVLKPKALVAQYAASKFAKQNAKSLKKLRECFRNFPPEQYRGVSREPLSRYGKKNSESRSRIREILGDEFSGDVNRDVDDDLLPSHADARNILSVVDVPSLWEIVHISRGNHSGGNHTLGFDIGYWGGDHLSLIADTIVTPRWHPPALDDFAELANAMSGMNHNSLFDSYEDANCFRKYYESKSWAETGEFWIIRVDEVI